MEVGRSGLWAPAVRRSKLLVRLKVSGHDNHGELGYSEVAFFMPDFISKENPVLIKRYPENKTSNRIL